jgi:hypothetical protein
MLELHHAQFASEKKLFGFISSTCPVLQNEFVLQVLDSQNGIAIFDVSVVMPIWI